MSSPSRPFRSGYAAALLALMLLTFATVRSSVMQAAELSPAGSAHCVTPMPGMEAMAGQGHAKRPHQATHKLCEFCIAAANAPLAASTTPLRTPSSVAWTPTVVRTALGPRGPPAFRPRSRGPPSPPLTA